MWVRLVLCLHPPIETGLQRRSCSIDLFPDRHTIALIQHGLVEPRPDTIPTHGGRATYYRSLVDWAWRDAPVIAALTMLVAAKSRWGFLKCCDRLRLDGHGWNHKRLPVQPRQPVAVIPQPNAVWVVDFMSNTLYGDRRVPDAECAGRRCAGGVGIEMDTSLSVERVIRLVGQVVSWRGQPQAIRFDKGPEFIAEQFITWCTERAIQLSHVHPGKSDQSILV